LFLLWFLVLVFLFVVVVWFVLCVVELSSPGTAAQRLRSNSTAGPATASVRCHSGLLRVQTWVAVGRLYVCDVLCMYSVYVLGVFFFHAAPCGRVSYQCVPYQCVPCIVVCASGFGLCANCVCVSCYFVFGWCAALARRAGQWDEFSVCCCAAV
jgi:hypothetical protein